MEHGGQQQQRSIPVQADSGDGQEGQRPHPPDDRGAQMPPIGRWFSCGRDRAYPSLLCVPQVLVVALVLRTHGRVRSIDGFCAGLCCRPFVRCCRRRVPLGFPLLLMVRDPGAGLMRGFADTGADTNNDN